MEIEDLDANAQCQPGGYEHDEEMGFCGMINENEDDYSIDALRNRNAQFILKTKETNMLTQKCVDNIVEDSTQLVRGTVKAIKSGLQNCLENAGINLGAVPGLNELFEEENPISNPFEHVSTKYKQNAYFEEHFGLVVSSTYFEKYYFRSNISQHTVGSLIDIQVLQIWQLSTF